MNLPSRAAGLPRHRESPRAGEMRVLLACAGGATAVRRLVEVASSSLDWPWLVRTSLRHSMTPVLHEAVERHDLRMPTTVRAELTAMARAIARRNLLLSGELVNVLSALAAHGIAATAFRGPTLAALAYGNISGREFEDLDLLVHPADVDGARRVLLARGYRWKQPLHGAQEEAYRRYAYDYQFVRDDLKLRVEVHWRLMPPRFPSLDVPSVVSRRRAVQVGGHPVSTFASEDLLLLLAVHAAKHAWERVGWIADVAALVDRTPALAWDTVMNRAAAYGLQRVVRLALLLVHAVGGPPFPPHVESWATADAHAREVAADVHERLLADAPPLSDAGELFRFHLRLFERLRDRVRYCVTPTAAEPEFLALPRGLHPLYYLLRPVRLVARHAPGAAAGVRRPDGAPGAP